MKSMLYKCIKNAPMNGRLLFNGLLISHSNTLQNGCPIVFDKSFAPFRTA